MKTQLNEVKLLARAMLMLDPQPTKMSPFVISHPFTNSGIVGITGDGGIRMLNIIENHKDLNEWQRFMAKQIERADSAFEIYMMLNTPYALTFLNHAQPYLSQKDFTKILANAWIQTEMPHQDPDVNRQQLVSMFRRASPHLLMDEDEYRQFRELEDELTIYRGVTPYNAKSVRALSWTLDRDTAEWFAHRFDQEGTVYEATIKKDHVCAVFNGRNESEVIVDPKYLTGIRQAPEMEQDVGQTMG